MVGSGDAGGGDAGSWIDSSVVGWGEERFATPLPIASELAGASCREARLWKLLRVAGSLRGRLGCMALGRSIGSFRLALGSLLRFDQGMLNDCKGTFIPPVHRRSRVSGSGSAGSLVGLGFEFRRRLRSPWPLPGLDFELGESFGSNSGRSLCAKAGLAEPRRARSRANRKRPRGAKRSEQRAIMVDRSGSGAWNLAVEGLSERIGRMGVVR